MGDRANVCVKNNDDDNGVYLYTHWYGTELPFTLQNALLSRQRWQDTAYLTRIIFSEMITVHDEVKSFLGYGISTFVCDGHKRILYVNCRDLTIKRSDSDKQWTFEQYVNLNNEELENVW